MQANKAAIIRANASIDRLQAKIFNAKRSIRRLELEIVEMGGKVRS